MEHKDPMGCLASIDLQVDQYSCERTDQINEVFFELIQKEVAKTQQQQEQLLADATSSMTKIENNFQIHCQKEIEKEPGQKLVANNPSRHENDCWKDNVKERFINDNEESLGRMQLVDPSSSENEIPTEFVKGEKAIWAFASNPTHSQPLAAIRMAPNEIFTPCQNLFVV